MRVINTKLRNVLVATTLVAVAGPVHADTTFGVGSLIIPASASYQHDCGAVAMYGLVYDVLRANEFLEQNKATFCPSHTAGQTCKIEIYYTYNENKKSPNRCTPTNRHAGPAYVAGASGTYPAVAAPLDNDAMWNDGCDFTVSDSTQRPVMLVNNSSTAAAFDTQIQTFNTTTKSSGANQVYPRWPAVDIQYAIAASRVDTVRYWGGSFVVSDVDAPVFLQLISGTLPAPGNGGRANDKIDGSGNWIDFSPFRANGANPNNYPIDATTCSFGTTVGGYVRIHRVMATVGVTAPTPKVFSAAPPRLALLARNANQSPAAGGSSTSFGTNSETGRVDDSILQKYLNNGGLKFTGANGCPPGAYWATAPNVSATLCPAGGIPGQIYDTFDFHDLVNGKLNLTWTSGLDIGKPIYKMLWAPHWEWKTTSANGTGSPTGNESPVMSAISTFLDGSTGLMAECASIETFEGANGGVGNQTIAIAAGKIQTCPLGVCSGAPTSYGLNKGIGSVPTGSLHNCSDPTGGANPLNTGGTGDCAYYAAPGDPFVQTGDFLFHMYTSPSRVGHFLPVTGGGGSQYKPGVTSLVSAVTAFNKANLPAPFGPGTVATARTMAIADYATRNNKDNDPAKGNILYLAGHDMSGSVAGTKMVLQTLLQLGTLPSTTTDEVSRNTPIAFTVNGTPSILQGTFERVTPGGTTLTLTSSADNTTFRFPDVKGHLRAVPLASYSTTAGTFTALDASKIFDAAIGIPNSTTSYTGCTRYAAGCRTVFTNLTGGFRPNLGVPTVIEQASIATVGPLMASGLTATEHAVLIQRVLNGVDGATPGTFAPALGGVDRSTVAVIPQSTVAGTARPTIAYFGATDGMLHAVCVDLVSPCTTRGQELWAFMPRNQLSSVRLNTTRIDGSPRVSDLYGDFTTSGTRSFRTILSFHTTSGDPTVATKTPAVYALDITNPAAPTIVFEYQLANPASRGTLEMSQGVTLAQGNVNVAGANKVALFAHASNGGTGGAGSVVTAINMETGGQLWTASMHASQIYANPPRASGSAIPQSAIPGGVVGVDLQGFGTLTDLIVPTIYGDIWQLNANTGVNKHGANPLFRFSANGHPFGSPVAIYSSLNKLYAIAAAGGYHDLTAGTQWSTPPHMAVAVSLSTPTASTPLNEVSGAPYVPFTVPFAAGQAAFTQPQVIGGELFITTDSTDINSLTYGTGTTDTGMAYKVDLSNPTTLQTSVVIRGGASSVAGSGVEVIAASSNRAVKLANVTNLVGEDASPNAGAKVARKLWLRTL